jgi:hypothetical protein
MGPRSAGQDAWAFPFSSLAQKALWIDREKPIENDLDICMSERTVIGVVLFGLAVYRLGFQVP